LNVATFVAKVKAYNAACIRMLLALSFQKTREVNVFGEEEYRLQPSQQLLQAWQQQQQLQLLPLTRP